jgi:hypothetical protein
MVRFAVSVFVVFALLSTQSAFARILPINKLSRFDQVNRTHNIDEREFRLLAKRVYSEFRTVVRHHGGELQLVLEWANPEVNAFADRKGDNWQILLAGGLARRPELTRDGFTLVVCHELGHHLAGYPFVYGDWGASEGESDYWATQVCARRLWSGDYDINASFRNKVPEETRFSCNMLWTTQSRRDLCYRVSAAGISLATLLARLGGKADPSMRGRDREKVDTTDVSHPNSQCRLDTLLAGALCNAHFDLGEIPGLDTRRGIGSNSQEAELRALGVSCSQEKRYDPRYSIRYGARPLCWFAPVTSEGAGKR